MNNEKNNTNDHSDIEEDINFDVSEAALEMPTMSHEVVFDNQAVHLPRQTHTSVSRLRPLFKRLPSVPKNVGWVFKLFTALYTLLVDCVKFIFNIVHNIVSAILTTAQLAVLFVLFSLLGIFILFLVYDLCIVPSNSVCQYQQPPSFKECLSRQGQQIPCKTNGLISHFFDSYRAPFTIHFAYCASTFPISFFAYRQVDVIECLFNDVYNLINSHVSLPWFAFAFICVLSFFVFRTLRMSFARRNEESLFSTMGDCAFYVILLVFFLPTLLPSIYNISQFSYDHPTASFSFLCGILFAVGFSRLIKRFYDAMFSTLGYGNVGTNLHHAPHPVNTRSIQNVQINPKNPSGPAISASLKNSSDDAIPIPSRSGRDNLRPPFEHVEEKLTHQPVYRTTTRLPEICKHYGNNLSRTGTACAFAGKLLTATHTFAGKKLTPQDRKIEGYSVRIPTNLPGPKGGAWRVIDLQVEALLGEATDSYGNPDLAVLSYTRDLSDDHPQFHRAKDFKEDDEILVQGYYSHNDFLQFSPGLIGPSTANGFVEHDASTLPGVSGGPILNTNGQLVGIHAQRGSDPNTNLFVPVPKDITPILQPQKTPIVSKASESYNDNVVHSDVDDRISAQDIDPTTDLIDSRYNGTKSSHRSDVRTANFRSRDQIEMDNYFAAKKYNNNSFLDWSESNKLPSLSVFVDTCVNFAAYSLKHPTTFDDNPFSKFSIAEVNRICDDKQLRAVPQSSKAAVLFSYNDYKALQGLPDILCSAHVRTNCSQCMHQVNSVLDSYTTKFDRRAVNGFGKVICTHCTAENPAPNPKQRVPCVSCSHFLMLDGPGFNRSVNSDQR